MFLASTMVRMERPERGQPMRRQCHWWAAAFAAAVAGAAVPGAAQAAEPPAIVVVLDYSRSMWGPLEGTKQSKYLTARDALRAGLRKLDPSTRIGIAAFGHRRNECSDAELLRHPEPLDVDRTMMPLEPLVPRGTGPLSLVMRETAKALPKDGSARSIVLVHDDSDNCNSDLCAVANELRTAGITAYVVGLATKAADLGRVACLPQLTGGRHFNALNTEQASAYLEEALRSAAANTNVLPPDPAARPPAAAAARQQPIVPPEPVPAAGPALQLRALQAPNTQPIATPLSWTVAAEDRPDVALFEAHAANPVVPVAPGRYIVEAREGILTAKQAVEVRTNRPVPVAVVLNAGGARVRAVAARSSSAIADAVVTLSDAAGALLLASRTGEVDVLLPAGRYVARVEVGLVRAEQALTISAGKQHDVDIPLNLARLTVTATGREPGAADTVTLSLVEDDPDAPQGRRELARSAAHTARFVMPPGPYHVVARQGAFEVRERLTIGGGDVKRLALNVAAGRLAISARSGAAETPAIEHASHTVVRLDGAPQEPVTTTLPSSTLLLPAGRYRVESRLGPAGAPAVREVEVRAGQTTQLVLEQQLATLKMRLSGAGAGETWWEVLDETGRGLWMDGQAEPTASLPAGRYLVRAEIRDKRYERAVELRAGETKLLDMPAQ
jgi:Ca-activated chloride channel family protein